MTNTDAQQVCIGQELCFLVYYCCAKTAHSRAPNMLSGSVLFCKKQLTAALCHYCHTFAKLPFTQVCNCSTMMHSRFAQDTKHAFWLSAALQKQLTAALCHYSHNCASLLFIQVCKCLTLMHNRLAQNIKTCFLAQCCTANTVKSSLLSLHPDLCKVASLSS